MNRKQGEMCKVPVRRSVCCGRAALMGSPGLGVDLLMGCENNKEGIIRENINNMITVIQFGMHWPSELHNGHSFFEFQQGVMGCRL